MFLVVLNSGVSFGIDANSIEEAWDKVNCLRSGEYFDFDCDGSEFPVRIMTP